MKESEVFSQETSKQEFVKDVSKGGSLAANSQSSPDARCEGPSPNLGNAK